MLNLIRNLYIRIQKIKKLPNKINQLFEILWRDAIKENRAFIYGWLYKTVDSLDMESSSWTYETILSGLQDENKNLKILDYWCWRSKSSVLKKLWFNDITSCDIINYWWDNFVLINPLEIRLPLEDKKYDITICSEVLEHVYSPFTLLEELIRVTKWSIYITTPNLKQKRSKFNFLLTWYFLWFQPENFDYHKTPIFSWQIENFLNERNIEFIKYWNHQILWLKWDIDNYAETLIYKINLND